MKIIHFFGSRVVKTGIAVLLTALICEWLNWPPVFAVITAIVTIEPTVSDSIKKGIIRFPASVIGSGYAVILLALFGNAPITYALAAVLTIMTCFKLNLHAGLLVATLTAVTMIEVVDSNYFLMFVTRLGTTTVGLLVSTGVNMFVMPPNYKKEIVGHIKSIGKKTGIILEKTFSSILDAAEDSGNSGEVLIHKHYREIKQAELLIRFQNDESKYHPLIGKKKRQFLQAESQLTWLRMIHYHLDNLNHLPIEKVSWNAQERELIMIAVTDLRNGLQDPINYNLEKHQQQLKQLTEIFWEDNEEITKHNKKHPTIFPPELIVLYELVSIYNLVERFNKE